MYEDKFDKYLKDKKRITVKTIAKVIYSDLTILDLTEGKRYDDVCILDPDNFNKFKNYYVAGIRARDGYIELAITRR